MIVKEFLRRIIFLLKKKPYLYKIYETSKTRIFQRHSEKEFFFGYYDKSPEKNIRILFHEMNKDCISLFVRNLNNEREIKIGVSKAYNWQMGARAIWVDDDIISYNDFDGDKYISRWYSLSQRCVIKTVPMPLMDIYSKNFILTTNFQRLKSVDSDYSYHCLPEMEDNEFYNYDKDGIWI